MRILPVMDLKQGQVVHGIAGRRDAYLPVESQLACDASAGSIAAAFLQLGLDTTYVADLDAISGASPDWNQLGQIANYQPSVWLDAGIGTPDRVAEIDEFAGRCPARVTLIVGLESVASVEDLQALFATIGPDRAVFSLDLKHGRPLNNRLPWSDLPPWEIAELVCRIGFRKLIVLDLASVGTGQGVSVEAVCREVGQRLPDVELLAGGGVRGLVDLRRLSDSGCHGALVASALHDGRLSREDLVEALAW